MPFVCHAASSCCYTADTGMQIRLRYRRSAPGTPAVTNSGPSLREARVGRRRRRRSHAASVLSTQARDLSEQAFNGARSRLRPLRHQGRRPPRRLPCCRWPLRPQRRRQHLWRRPSPLAGPGFSGTDRDAMYHPGAGVPSRCRRLRQRVGISASDVRPAGRGRIVAPCG